LAIELLPGMKIDSSSRASNLCTSTVRDRAVTASASAVMGTFTNQSGPSPLRLCRFWSGVSMAGARHGSPATTAPHDSTVWTTSRMVLMVAASDSTHSYVPGPADEPGTSFDTTVISGTWRRRTSGQAVRNSRASRIASSWAWRWRCTSLSCACRRADAVSGSSRARRTSLTLIPVPRSTVISMARSTWSNVYER
jgi:hypothetical protein